MLSTAPPLLELELELLLPLELLVLPPELLLVPPPELPELPVLPPELELLLELPDLGSSVPVDSPQAETAMAEAIAKDKHSALRQPVFLFIVISTRRTAFFSTGIFRTMDAAALVPSDCAATFAQRKLP